MRPILDSVRSSVSARGRWVLNAALDAFWTAPKIMLPGGCRILIHQRNEYIQREILRHGVYEPSVVGLIIALGHQGTFLDVGANIGQHSLISLGQGMTVHAFEPEPRLFQRLAENQRLNDTQGRMTVNRCAVSDQAGEYVLHVVSGSNSGASSLLQSAALHSTRSLTVPAITLDGYLAGLSGFPSPLLIKIDVEGWEARVLDGATETMEQRRAVFVVETGHSLAEGIAEGTRSVIERFTRRDYRVWMITPSGELVHQRGSEISSAMANYLCVAAEQVAPLRKSGLV